MCSLNSYLLTLHSRYTEVRKNGILRHPELMVLAGLEEAGALPVMNCDGSQVFVQGHPEYDRTTLSSEYHRDLSRGLDPELPCSCYEHDDPLSVLTLTWRNTSNTLCTNRPNYYIYQATSYALDEEE